jgi:hypothetical protein
MEVQKYLKKEIAKERTPTSGVKYKQPSAKLASTSQREKSGHVYSRGVDFKEMESMNIIMEEEIA